MDNRWIWILLFCLTVMLAAWELREQHNDLLSETTLGSIMYRASFEQVRKALIAGFDFDKPLIAANKEEAISLALQTAYGPNKSWSHQFLDVHWLPFSVAHTTSEDQDLVILAGTLFPKDGFVAVFSLCKQGYTLLDLTTEVSRIDSISLKQLVDDPAEEIALTHTYDELVGAFFKITTCTLLKWSHTRQNLSTIWEYPLALEQYDPTSKFKTRQTRRSQIQFGSNQIDVYEVTTDWELDQKQNTYCVVKTSVQNRKYTWDNDSFSFVAVE